MSAVTRFMAALSCFWVFSASADRYLDRLEAFHQQYGHRVFDLSVTLGTNGNKLAYMGELVSNFVRVLPLMALLAILTWRISKFFSDQKPAPMLERFATGAAMVLLVLWLGTDHALAGPCTTADSCICNPPGAHPGGGTPPPTTEVIVLENVGPGGKMGLGA